jgi:predicted NAD/FAD-binding protein/uncharacterized protein YeaO (DUF488 family)
MKRFTRRDALKGAAAVGVAGLGGCGRSAPPVASGPLPEEQLHPGPEELVSGKPRVAIVGGGIGGIAAAYFLDAEWEVELFEGRDRLGGHCDTRTVEVEGRSIAIDLGAQFFHPDTHPLYVTLLEELGLYDPAQPEADQILEAAGSLCIFPESGGTPLLASTVPTTNLLNGLDFAAFTQQARAAVKDLSWDVKLDDWISGLTLRGPFKDQVLRPWITSLIGADRASAARTSARSILMTFALAFPTNVFAGAKTYNSKIGLGGNLLELAKRAPGTRFHTGAQVKGLEYAAGKWKLLTAAGERSGYDALVINAPGRYSKELLRPLSWTGHLVDLLSKESSFKTRMLVHTDAAYVTSDRKLWGVYNAGITDAGECEGSVWLGGIHDKLPSDSTVEIFKSWAQRRKADPRNILFERSFEHTLIDEGTLAMARGLRSQQGRNNLYFSGHHTTGVDMQDSALFSAMQVARSLSPRSPALERLQRRLEIAGRAGVTYEISMPIKTDRWCNPRGSDDGFRVLITRYRPRALPKAKETWDAWEKALGPSPELLAAFKGKGQAPIDLSTYRKRYREEMRAQGARIAALAARVKRGETVTLLCSRDCLIAEACHRTVLAQLIEAAVADG